ncbi:MAG: NAD-dependent DNA ligase LigA, partial [Salinivirgaceae bacterium]|nr:NAD-dependent DNA ligase LigA [Salinivirgaceae bacterium]
IVDYFAEDGNRLFVNRLIGYGLQFEAARQEAKSAKLEGLTIIASGKLEHFSRDEINHTIEAHGGKPVTSVSSKTDYLIAGENIGPNKLAKARELGIPIITEAEFMQMIADDDVSQTAETQKEKETDKPADTKPKNDGPTQLSLF